jgi:hypothetical protein
MSAKWRNDMAIQRYISTSFWDDAWIQMLKPEEKLIFIYLITNPLTSIAGIYKITIRRMVFDTGLSQEIIAETLKMFADSKKAILIKGEWIIIPNWVKHQRIAERSNIKKGIDAVLLDLPDDVWNLLPGLGYQYMFLENLGRPFNDVKVPPSLSKTLETSSSPSKGVEGPSKTFNYSDTDTDTDTDLIYSESDDSLASKPKPAEPPILSNKDPDLEIYHSIERSFLSRNGDRFTSWGKEGKAIKEIIKKARIRAPDDYGALIQQMMEKLWELKNSGDRFWRGQPFLPSALNAAGIWDRVLEEFREESGYEITDEEFEQLVREAAG